MKITTSQIFQIGAAVIGFLIVILPLFGLDAKTVALVGGAAGALWGTIGGILTTTTAQANAVVANKNDPATQELLTKAVASYPGLDPLQTNDRASPTLQRLAASNAPDAAKIQ